VHANFDLEEISQQQAWDFLEQCVSCGYRSDSDKIDL
jgi:hypothetical protein